MNPLEKLQFRKSEPRDLPAMSHLIRESTAMVTRNAYSPEQRDNWMSENTVAKLAERRKQNELFCLYQGEELLGVIGLKGSELISLYVDYRRIGEGLGKQLLHHLEAYARSQGITELHLSATKSGENFYQRNGFQAQGSSSVVINGVTYHELLMTKEL